MSAASNQQLPLERQTLSHTTALPGPLESDETGHVRRCGCHCHLERLLWSEARRLRQTELLVCCTASNQLPRCSMGQCADWPVYHNSTAAHWATTQLLHTLPHIDTTQTATPATTYCCRQCNEPATALPSRSLAIPPTASAAPHKHHAPPATHAAVLALLCCPVCPYLLRAPVSVSSPSFDRLVRVCLFLSIERCSRSRLFLSTCTTRPLLLARRLRMSRCPLQPSTSRPSLPWPPRPCQLAWWRPTRPTTAATSAAPAAARACLRVATASSATRAA